MLRLGLQILSHSPDGFPLCVCVTAAGPVALRGCPKPQLCDCSGKAVSVYHALSASLLIVKQRVREASETYMTKPLHQGANDQMG